MADKFSTVLSELLDVEDSQVVRQTLIDLVNAARRTGRGLSDLERVERDRARKLLNSLVNLRQLQRDENAAKESRETFFRSITLNPASVLKEYEFLREALGHLVDKEIQTSIRRRKAELRHVGLVNRENRRLAAAKARAARAAKARK